MAKREEFDRDDIFDFDPNEILDEEPGTVDVEFDFMEELPQMNKQTSPDEDLDDLLSADFLTMLGMEPADESEPLLQNVPFTEEPVPEEPAFEEPFEAYEPEALSAEAEDDDDMTIIPQAEDDADMKEFPAPPVPAFDVEMELDEEFIKSVEEVFPADEAETPAQTASAAENNAEKKEAPVRRRKKMSRERIIKEVYLPPVILGLTLILLLTFIGSAIGRAIKNNQEQQAAIQSSEQEASSALAQEAQLLVDEADAGIQRFHRSGEADRFAIQQNLAAVSRENTAKNVHQCGFACAVFAQKRTNFPGRQAEVNFRQHIVGTEGFANLFH